MDFLSLEEKERYSRHLILPEFGMEGQMKLKKAKVLVVGAGGLGVPVLQYLVAVGVGFIGIADADQVEITNLQRQVLYDTSDLGKPKVEVAARKLKALNPHVELLPISKAVTIENAMDLVGQFDLVVDGSDNFTTRYLVNDACVLSGKPLVYASIFRFEGQASVFNLTNEHGEVGPNYRDLFPEPPPLGMVPDCAEGGVLGVLPGLLGCIQANEAIKVITGLGQSLAGRLFVLDALKFESRIFAIPKDPQNPLTGLNPTQFELIDYDVFCGLEPAKMIEDTDYKTLKGNDLKKWMQDGFEFQWIDVREQEEQESSPFPAESMPLSMWEVHMSNISQTIPVVVMCQRGKRSVLAIRKFLDAGCKAEFYTLEGGASSLGS
jgi:adenylyltransferase/sulfurtransferase